MKRKKKTLYLEGAVHQSLIQVYDHADLPLVLGIHGRQEAEFMLLSGQDRHTPQHRGTCCAYAGVSPTANARF